MHHDLLLVVFTKSDDLLKHIPGLFDLVDRHEIPGRTEQSSASVGQTEIGLDVQGEFDTQRPLQSGDFGVASAARLGLRDGAREAVPQIGEFRV